MHVNFYSPSQSNCFNNDGPAINAIHVHAAAEDELISIFSTILRRVKRMNESSGLSNESQFFNEIFGNS